jgi:Spy/CpxP family protein refolding chaperone
VAANAGGFRLEFLKRAEKDLDLSPEQKDQIDKILSASQERTRKIMQPEFQRTREEFKTVLTPEQRNRFEQLLKQQRNREPKRPARLLESPSGHTNSAPSIAP